MFNGNTLPIGYIINKEQHFQIAPVIPPFVLAAFKKYADSTKVRDYLNEKSVNNTSGKPMANNIILHLLDDRHCISEYVCREIVAPD